MPVQKCIVLVTGRHTPCMLLDHGAVRTSTATMDTSAHLRARSSSTWERLSARRFWDAQSLAICRSLSFSAFSFSSKTSCTQPMHKLGRCAGSAVISVHIGLAAAE